MKPVIIAAALTATSAIAGPYVGIERAFEGLETTPYVGVEGEVIFEGVGLAKSGNLDLRVDLNSKSQVNNINVDGSISLSESMSVYTENDLDKDLNQVETLIGIRYAF